MSKSKKPLRAVLALSGGMDSSSLLVHLLARGYEVKVLSFNYGQKHVVELEKAKSLIKYLDSIGPNQDKLTKSRFYKMIKSHTIVDLSSIAPLLNSNLVQGGEDVPEGHYESSNMKETVVPNRNKIFASILQSVALSWANEVSAEVKIAMGIHAGDHEIYPDCRQEFRDVDYKAFVEGNWDANKVSYYTPFLHMDKSGILRGLEDDCATLSSSNIVADFNKILERTNTSYKPLEYNGVWYSDYKSASSVERIEAFIRIGKPDPVKYADETGPVDWNQAKTHVEAVLKQGKTL